MIHDIYVKLYLILPVIGLHLQLNKKRYTAPAQSGFTR